MAKRILGIIPARKGSKRLKHKNILELNGNPLYHYVVNSARESKYLNDIAFTTDDQRILRQIHTSYPEIIGIARPSEIASDTAPAIAYVQHALDYLQKSAGNTYDIVVILQPTSPLTNSQDIDNTISLLQLNQDAESAVSIVKLDHMVHPLKLKTFDGRVLHPYFDDEKNRMAAHELPEVYVRNCSVYATRASCIAKGKVIGEPCLGYEMPRERSVDINDWYDFQFASFLMKGEGSR